VTWYINHCKSDTIHR